MTQKYIAPHTIVATSPDAALYAGLHWLKTAGAVNDSRNGRVLVSPVPVITAYPKPMQRVLTSPLRDANPFFHFFEALWMLAGKNEAAQVANYAKQMETFADDGLLWGAYGFRWRHFFAFDQLRVLVELLRKDPKTRRAVLTMWTPNGDLVASEGVGGVQMKDIPCNTQVYFDGTGGVLNMSVSNRSNDIVWGAYGANIVHMSMLHEFMASATGIPLGTYYQFSNNYHLYPDRPDVQRLISQVDGSPRAWQVLYTPPSCIYEDHGLRPQPMFSTDDPGGEGFLADCEAFVDDPATPRGYTHNFFSQVAWPLMAAHAAYKEGNHEAALRLAQDCTAPDWKLAAVEWLVRRHDAKQAAARRLMANPGTLTSEEAR